MEVSQPLFKATEQYPWAHRVEPRDGTVALVHRWTINENVPGVWTGCSFYTTEEYAALMLLTWADA